MEKSAPVALVTGASRGIGRGIAVELARLGWAVAINYVANREAAEQCRQACEAAAPASAEKRGASKDSFITVQADISRADDRTRLVESVAAHFGWIDLLVNNAGVAPSVRADLLESTEESFDRLIATNLKGPYFLTQQVARFWTSRARELQSASRKPMIVTVSSVSAEAASIQRGEYCVSKAALAMMTKLFACRLAEFGILVYELRPGIVSTEMTQLVKGNYDALIANGLTPVARWGTPEDVALAVAAIAERRFPFSTGEVVHIDGGLHIPRL